MDDPHSFVYSQGTLDKAPSISSSTETSLLPWDSPNQLLVENFFNADNNNTKNNRFPRRKTIIIGLISFVIIIVTIVVVLMSTLRKTKSDPTTTNTPTITTYIPTATGIQINPTPSSSIIESLKPASSFSPLISLPMITTVDPPVDFSTPEVVSTSLAVITSPRLPPLPTVAPPAPPTPPAPSPRPTPSPPPPPVNTLQTKDFRVTDGNTKIIRTNGEFVVNSKLLGTGGTWVSDTKYIVLVPSWGNIYWVGDVVEGGLITSVAKTEAEARVTVGKRLEKFVNNIK